MRSLALVPVLALTVFAMLANPALAHDPGRERGRGHGPGGGCGHEHRHADYRYVRGWAGPRCPPPPVRVSHPFRPVRAGGWDRGLVGTVIGGTAGGLLGNTVGKGSGRTAAVIGGTIVGALVGGSIGRSMERTDYLWVSRTLEYAPSREPVRWVNPDTRTSYEVEALSTHVDRAGRYCREYQTTATVAGERRQVYGTACRQPDGSWEVVN